MKKKKYVKKSKALTIGILTILVLVGACGALGAVTKGFQDWNIFQKKDVIEEDDRIGLKITNLKTTIKGSALNETSVISYLNEGLGEDDPVFKEVESITAEDGTISYSINNLYKDNGGMKFGTSSKLGSFSIALIDDYSFNRAKIIGRNYSALNSATNVYSCDESGLSVNGAEMQYFGTNVEDTKKEAPTEEKIFAFEQSQNILKIDTIGKRCTVFTIELWTEL